MGPNGGSVAMDSVLIHTGKGEGVGEPVRRLEGRLFTRGVENTIMTDYLQSIKSIIHQ